MLDPPLSSSAPQLTMTLSDSTIEPTPFQLDVDMTIEGFGDDDDLCVFRLEEDEVDTDPQDEYLPVDGGWNWAGTAKLRHDSLDSTSTCESTPPPSFVGSPVLHACLQELREKRGRTAT